MSKRFIDLGASKMVSVDGIEMITCAADVSSLTLRGGQLMSSRLTITNLGDAIKAAAGSVISLGGRQGYVSTPPLAGLQTVSRRTVVGLVKFCGMYESDSRYINLDAIDGVERMGELTALHLRSGRSERISSLMLPDLIECLTSAYGPLIQPDKVATQTRSAA